MVKRRISVRVESRRLTRSDLHDDYEYILTRQDEMLLEQICQDIEKAGYEVQPIVIPACAVNAPHIRARVWILAHSTGIEQSGQGSLADTDKKPFNRTRPESIDVCWQRREASGLQGCWSDYTWITGHDGKQRRIPQPGFCCIFDGHSNLNDRKHYNLFEKGKINASTDKTRPDKILRILRKAIETEKNEWATGRSWGVSAEEILQSYLRKLKKEYSKISTSPKGEEISEKELRALPHNGKYSCSPPGFRPYEQRPAELTDIMRLMSSKTTLDRSKKDPETKAILQILRCGIAEIETWILPKTLPEIQEVWKTISDKSKRAMWSYIGGIFYIKSIPLLTTGFPKRADFLKLFGNAIVYPVAREIMMAIKTAGG